MFKGHEHVNHVSVLSNRQLNVCGPFIARGTVSPYMVVGTAVRPDCPMPFSCQEVIWRCTFLSSNI